MRVLRLFAAVLLPLFLIAVPCGGEETGEQPEADTAAVDIFRPTWDSWTRSNDSEIKLGSSARVQLDPGGGWIISNSIKMERTKYRLRNTEGLTEELTGAAGRIDPELYIFNFRIGESFTKETLLGLARFGKDLIVNDESASFDFVLTRPFLGARSSQVSITGDARRGTHDFKYDRTISGGAGAFLRYNLGDQIKVGGGFGTSVRREDSEIGSTIKFDGMPSRIDTIRAKFDYGNEESSTFHLEYNRNEGIERKVVPPRGNSLEILDDPEAAQEEEERKRNQLVRMSSFVQPLSYVSVDLLFEHDENEQRNRVDTRLNRDTKETSLKATVVYNYAEKGSATFNIENNLSDVDYGPVSLGSYEEKDKTVGMSLGHQVTDSMRVMLRGSTSLTQRFLKKREQNPRDRDILLYGGGALLTAVPHRNVKTSVDFTFHRRETINIDKTLSSDNRVDYLYRFVPNIRITPAGWVAIAQEYLLKFESTEFVFDENNNTLNRTIGVDTKADLMVLRPIRFTFSHSYKKRDTGSYLRRNGERLYGRTGENIDNNLSLAVRYAPVPEFSMRATAEFQTQESNRLSKEGGQTVIVSSSTFESGAFKVGFDRKRSIGAGGALDLKIDYVRRYGPNITAERREYWIVDATLNFKF